MPRHSFNPLTAMHCALISAALLLGACSQPRATTAMDTSDLRDHGIPDQGIAKHNPQPKQAYRITMTLHDAPGPFAVMQAYAQYDVTNEDTCGEISPDSGTAERVTRLEPFKLEKRSDSEYQGVVYADLMLDQDYFGRGVCHWELIMARIGLQATHASEDTDFLPTIDAAPLIAEQEVTTYFWRERYPRSQMDNFPDFGESSRETYRPEIRDALFSITLTAEKLP